MEPGSLPREVLEFLGAGTGGGHEVRVEGLRGGTGAATAAVERLHGRVRRDDSGDGPRSVVRKRLRPIEDGSRPAADPRHWTYWRRELEAYASGLLPAGDGLRSPRCYAATADELYLEDVAGPPPTAEQAAAARARWDVPFDPSRDRPWLTTDQLGDRLAVTTLDWQRVDADGRAEALWAQRQQHHQTLRGLPKVLSHGDFTTGNLVAAGDEVVAYDWGTFGWEPLGFDLAHLALSTGADPLPHHRKVDRDTSRYTETGFRCALAIIGPSRIHWMLSRAVPVPPWYMDFVWEHRPADR